MKEGICDCSCFCASHSHVQRSSERRFTRLEVLQSLEFLLLKGAFATHVSMRSGKPRLCHFAVSDVSSVTQDYWIDSPSSASVSDWNTNCVSSCVMLSGSTCFAVAVNVVAGDRGLAMRLFKLCAARSGKPCSQRTFDIRFYWHLRQCFSCVYRADLFHI